MTNSQRARPVSAFIPLPEAYSYLSYRAGMAHTRTLKTWHVESLLTFGSRSMASPTHRLERTNE